jgi:hypothetical protein
LCLLSLSHNNKNTVPPSKESKLLNGFPPLNAVKGIVKGIITKAKINVFSKKFWFRVFFIFVLGFILKLGIQYFGGVNVLLNLLHPASVGYHFAMAIATVSSEE